MNTYEVTHWVNYDEYLITHKIKSIALEMIDDVTIKLDNDVEIIFKRIQMITDTKNKVIIFDDDDY